MGEFILLILGQITELHPASFQRYPQKGEGLFLFDLVFDLSRDIRQDKSGTTA